MVTLLSQQQARRNLDFWLFPVTDVIKRDSVARFLFPLGVRTLRSRSGWRRFPVSAHPRADVRLKEDFLLAWPLLHAGRHGHSVFKMLA